MTKTRVENKIFFALRRSSHYFVYPNIWIMARPKLSKKLYFCLVFVTTIILIISAIHLFSLACNEFYMEYGMVLPQNTQREVLHDTSGGFARDWIRLYRFKFDDGQTEKFMDCIRDFGEWERTPMPNDLNILLYGEEGGHINYKFGEEAGLPVIKNGYWRYRPRRSGGYLECLSFSLSIYDLDNDVLYLLDVKI